MGSKRTDSPFYHGAISEILMISFSRWAVGLALFSLVPSAQFAPAQDKATTSPSPSNFSAEYPKDRAGIFGFTIADPPGEKRAPAPRKP
jgi:hypothetical protein